MGLGHNYSDVLDVLAEYGKLPTAANMRDVHHQKINQYWLSEHRYRQNGARENRDKRRLEEAKIKRREQVGMKIHINFPDGDPNCVFPFYVMTFDRHNLDGIACLSIFSDCIVIKAVEEVLIKAGIEFSRAGGRAIVFFDLKRHDTKESMLATIQTICEKLRGIVPGTDSKYYFDAEMEKLYRAARQFIYYNEVGFDRLYSNIELPKLVLQDAPLSDDDVIQRQVAQGMRSAFRDKAHAVEIIRKLLRLGVHPDHSNEPRDPGILQGVLSRKINTPEEMELWLTLLDLLLEYGADTRDSLSSERGCIWKLLQRYFSNETPLQEAFTVRALARMAHANRDGRPILIHADYLNTRIGRTLDAMNRFYATRRHVAPEITSTRVMGSSIYFVMRSDRNLSANNTKPCVIKVTTRKLRSLNPQEISALFAIFAERFADLAQEKGVSLEDYFAETLQEALAQSDAEPMVDLVEIVGEGCICAFNMFHTKLMRIDNEFTLVHRILLVAANRATAEQNSISHYKGFMSLLLYLRGFVLQARFPELKVCTILEALNGRTPAQLSQLGVEYYPLYSCLSPSTLRALQVQMYEAYDINFYGGCLHVDDVLAGPLSAPVAIPQQADDIATLGRQRGFLAVANYQRFFQQSGHATVLAFFNHGANLRRLKSSLDILIAQRVLENLISGLARLIKKDGSYQPVSINLSRM